MNDEVNCYRLALCVLRAEKDAHLILADLLEERGDAANAQFARGPKKSLRKRFDLTLGLLPAPAVLWLTCDLVEHVIETTDHFKNEANDLSLGLEILRNWSQTAMGRRSGEIDDEARLRILAQRCRSINDIAEQIPQDLNYAQGFPVNRVIESVPVVARATTALLDSGRITEWASTTAVGPAGRQAANRCRNVAALTRYRFYPNRQGWDAELRWQAECIEALVENLQRE